MAITKADIEGSINLVIDVINRARLSVGQDTAQQIALQKSYACMEQAREFFLAAAGYEGQGK